MTFNPTIDNYVITLKSSGDRIVAIVEKNGEKSIMKLMAKMNGDTILHSHELEFHIFKQLERLSPPGFPKIFEMKEIDTYFSVNMEYAPELDPSKLTMINDPTKCDIYSAGLVLLDIKYGDCTHEEFELIEKNKNSCDFSNLVFHMLDLNPDTRYSAKKCLNHVFFK
jgi:serine/threonine protein kinase